MIREMVSRWCGLDDVLEITRKILDQKDNDHAAELMRFMEAEAAKRQLMADGHAHVIGEIDARISQLKDSLAKTEAQRDYFRQRADRLELILLAPKTAEKTRERPRVVDFGAIGRKPWSQVVADHVAQNRKLDQEEAQKQAAEKAAEGTA